ncbi:MAG: DUF3386 family protein [Planctomycetaceae bacterium]|nr:DUF3386 family protein [Planctomycetaceae bacterium]
MISMARMKAELRLALLAGGLVAMSVWMTAFASGAEPTAAAMMQKAHDGRAVWTDFSGLTARVRCFQDGTVVEGQLVVERNGDVKLSLPKDDERFAWVQRTLDSVIGHRLSSDDAITNVEFADDQTNHPQGRLIRSIDSKDKSQWRAKGDVLTEVHRFGETSRFVISVAEVARTAEGTHLPRSYAVTTWETPSNRIQSVRQISQEWTRVGRFDLPAKHLAITNRSDGSRVTQQIEFLDYQITTATAAK